VLTLFVIYSLELLLWSSGSTAHPLGTSKNLMAMTLVSDWAGTVKFPSIFTMNGDPSDFFKYDLM